MRTSWKGISLVDESDAPLMLVTVRTELDIVVDAEGLQRMLGAVAQAAERKEISSDDGDSIRLQFENIQALIHALRDSPLEVRQARMETQWADFPIDDITNVLPMLKEAFASNSGFHLEGTAPNYTFVYHLGGRARPYPIAGPELAGAIAELAKVNESAIAFAIQEMSARNLTIAEGVAITVVVGVAGPAVCFGVAAGMAAVVAGTITAAQAASWATAVYMSLKSANEAYDLYKKVEAERKAKDRQEEARARREQMREEQRATRTRIIAGGDAITANGIA